MSEEDNLEERLLAKQLKGEPTEFEVEVTYKKTATVTVAANSKSEAIDKATEIAHNEKGKGGKGTSGGLFKEKYLGDYDIEVGEVKLRGL